MAKKTQKLKYGNKVVKAPEKASAVVRRRINQHNYEFKLKQKKAEKLNLTDPPDSQVPDLTAKPDSKSGPPDSQVGVLKSKKQKKQKSGKPKAQASIDRKQDDQGHDAIHGSVSDLPHPPLNDTKASLD